MPVSTNSGKTHVDLPVDREHSRGQILDEGLNDRGCNDTSPTGEALGAVFPTTTLQTCIVHLIRNSLDYASWKDRKALAAVIKPIYTALSAETAQAELEAFADGRQGQKFPTVATAWRRFWDKVIPFFGFPPAIIYTERFENALTQDEYWGYSIRKSLIAPHTLKAWHSLTGLNAACCFRTALANTSFVQFFKEAQQCAIANIVL